jgi:hypothetical protein
MNTQTLLSIKGIVNSVAPMSASCGNFLLSINTENGIVNIVLTPDTYVVDCTAMLPGMWIYAFYDGAAPALLIYPPQYLAKLIAPFTEGTFVAFQYFDNNLTAPDQFLRLNIAPATKITTANGQPFSCCLTEKSLLVFYSITTRSIPPQTTPHRIIVFS